MFKKNKKTTIKKREVKKEISSEKIIEKIRKVLFFLLLISFIGVTFWVLFFSFFVEIENIKVSGIQKDAVIKIVREVADSSYLNIIPKNNIILLSTSEIEKKIKTRWILAENIKIKKVFPNTIEVFFEERANVIIWCQEKSEQGCFLIDENGKAFYRINNEENLEEKFPIVYSKGTMDIEIGKLVVKPEIAKFCAEIAQSSENETGIVLDNKYYTPSFMSEEIRVETDQGWSVYFNSSATTYEQSRLLKSFLEKNIEKENFDKLEYIDLRLSGKVLYKLKGQENEEEENKDEDEKDLSEKEN